MIAAISGMQSILTELTSLAEAAAPPDAATPPSATTSSATSFAALFDAAVSRLNGDVATAGAKAHEFAAGGDIPLSDAMISLEQANLAVQLASNVRDKVTAAYDSVMNMQL